jgi:hypothetical protein
MGNKKVTCIDNSYDKLLEVGKEYEVIEEDEGLYLLRLPSVRSVRCIFKKCYFTEVEELESKLCPHVKSRDDDE